jgi:hypothetical protein
MVISIADQFMSNPNRLHVRQFTPYSFSPQEITIALCFSSSLCLLSLIPDRSLDDTILLRRMKKDGDTPFVLKESTQM